VLSGDEYRKNAFSVNVTAARRFDAQNDAKSIGSVSPLTEIGPISTEASTQSSRIASLTECIVERSGPAGEPWRGFSTRRLGRENARILSMEENLLGPDDERPARDVIIIILVFFEAGLAPFSIFLGWLLGHPPLQGFVWDANDALWGAAASVPLIVMFLTILIWPVGPLGRAKQFCENEIAPLFENCTWLDLAVYSVSAGVGEEMLFRGVLQPAFTQGLGPPWGLVLASVLFGLLQPVSLSYIAVAAIVGFYYGVVWIMNGNLLGVMVTHSLFGFAALAYLIRYHIGTTSSPGPIPDS
jgi:uncharacterized protein